MPTTLRIDDDLKQRVAVLAKTRGMTPHAFMVEIMEKTVSELEEDEAFHQLAEERYQEYVRTGRHIAWGDFEPYLTALARGEKPKRPKVSVDPR